MALEAKKKAFIEEDDLESALAAKKQLENFEAKECTIHLFILYEILKK